MADLMSILQSMAAQAQAGGVGGGNIGGYAPQAPTAPAGGSDAQGLATIQALIAANQAQQQEQLGQLGQPRPDAVEAEEIGGLQTAMGAIANALSAYAAGQNPNIRQRDYLGESRQGRQERADRETARGDQEYGDSLQSGLLQLQQLMGQGQDLKGDLRYQSEINRADSADTLNAARRAEKISGRQSFEAEQSRLSSEREADIRKDMFRMESGLRKSLAGVKETSEQRVNDDPFLAAIYSGVIETRKAIQSGSESASRDEILQDFKDDLDRMPGLSDAGKLKAIEYFNAQLNPAWAKIEADQRSKDFNKTQRELQDQSNRLPGGIVDRVEAGVPLRYGPKI